ncbi:hypothetical protein LCL95_00910 [Bacillus timonensis]|nr:hypothetical protein [Bacillus timonensis]
MSNVQEGMIFFGMMSVAAILSTLIIILLMNRTNKLFQSWMFGFVSSAALYGVASAIWFSMSIDGISQVIGVIIYSIVWGIGIIINTFVLFYMRKKMNLLN